jgi:hypothetical protein
MRLVGFAGASEVDWRQMLPRRFQLAATALFLLLSLLPAAGFAIRPPSRDGREGTVSGLSAPQDQEGTTSRILNKIEQAIQSGDVRALSGYFSSRVYIDLPSGEKGYYGSEQAYYILKGFLQAYAPVSFSFSSSSPRGDSPYGMGTYAYIKAGQRGRLQVFVSLRETNRQWKINQLTVAQR